MNPPQAAELSAEEQQERAEHCFAIEARIKAGLRAGREAMWEVAQALHEFDEQNGWTALGGYEKLADWLADPEVNMTRSTYYRLVSSYRELVVVRKVELPRLASLDVSKVDIVMSSVKAGTTTLGDALDDVEALGARDLRDKYLKRPDPKDSTITADDAKEQGAIPTPDGTGNGEVTTDDTPVRASDLAHNGNGVPSGQLPDIDGDTLVASEDDEEAPEPPTLGDAVKAARDALAMPQRLPGARQAIRGALEDLLDAVEHAKVKGRL